MYLSKRLAVEYIVNLLLRTNSSVPTCYKYRHVLNLTSSPDEDKQSKRRNQHQKVTLS